MYEHRAAPLLPRTAFLRRLARHGGIAIAVVAVSLAIGIFGYHVLEGLAWIDALLNVAMILGGMGPVDHVQTAAGKIFAAFYALYSGLIVLVVAGVLFAPGISRDDAGSFLPDYQKRGIFANDPLLSSIDVEGVGELVTIAVERGRKTRKDIKLGICGEHGGDPASIQFFNEVGLDYVSCSPYRVPIARLAAAQAMIRKG